MTNVAVVKELRSGININVTLTAVGGSEGREVGLSIDVAADDLGLTGYGRYE